MKYLNVLIFSFLPLIGFGQIEVLNEYREADSLLRLDRIDEACNKFKDLEKRYHNSSKFNFNKEESNKLNDQYHIIEYQLFAKIDLKPEDITSESVEQFIITN